MTVAYSTTLAAVGGTQPYSWTRISGSLPDGLNLSSAGIIGGTPTRAGVFTFTVRASDNANLTSEKVLTISIGPATPGALTLTGIPTTLNPTQQMPIGLVLAAPQSTPISGLLVLTFTPNSSVPIDDPAVQFSNGARTVNFNIPAFSTAAIFPGSSLLLLAGTESGTITITANVVNGPTGVQLTTTVIQTTVPQLTAVTAERTADGLSVQIVGYSPDRRVMNAQFTFELGMPTGTQQVNLSRSVDSDFAAWYRSSASASFGSSFSFDQLFQVQGDPRMIQAVTVTLTNETGSATSVRTVVPGT